MTEVAVNPTGRNPQRIPTFGDLEDEEWFLTNNGELRVANGGYAMNPLTGDYNISIDDDVPVTRVRKVTITYEL